MKLPGGRENNLRGSMLTKLSDSLGVNRVVLALSVARLGDAIGNSILFIVIPLFVAQLPSPWFPFPDTVRIGFLIAVYGIVNALLQPVMGALSRPFDPAHHPRYWRRIDDPGFDGFNGNRHSKT